MNYKSILAAAALATAPVLASAGTIDFTDRATYGGATASSITGTTDFGVNYTVSGTPTGNLSFSQAYDGDTGATGGLAEQIDGLGIGDDEISNGPGASVPPASRKQVVTVAFDSAVSIVGLHFLDLFLSPDMNDPMTDAERMQVWINKTDTDFTGNGDRRVFAVAPDGDASGYKFDDLSNGVGGELFDVVTSISFTSSRGNDAVGVADGALAGIDVLAGNTFVAPIPLPASILLLLGGLGSLTALRRRKTA